jgi:hypothetical protein
MNKSGLSVVVVLFLILVFFDMNSIECKKKKKKGPPRNYGNSYQTRLIPVQLKSIAPNGQTTNDRNGAQLEKPKPKTVLSEAIQQ